MGVRVQVYLKGMCACTSVFKGCVGFPVSSLEIFGIQWAIDIVSC